MNTSGPWDIWLYSTNTLLFPDDNNEVAIASLPQVDEVHGWTKLSVVSIEPDDIQLDGLGDSQGGFYNDSWAQYRQFVIESMFFYYPTDKAIRDNVNKVFRKKQKFICIDGFSQDANEKFVERIHTSGKALEVKLVSKTLEYDKETGTFSLSLTLRCNNPIKDA